MRRITLALLSTAALSLPLTFVTTGTAVASSTDQTGTCTDGGGHVWKAKTTWSSTTYRGADRATHVVDDSLGFTSGAKDATTVDYTVTTFNGSGQVTGTFTKDDKAYDFKQGTRYLTVNPYNPQSSPGRSSIVLSVGDGNDGRSNCSVTFTQPGATSSPAPTSGPCSAANQILRIAGQGSKDLGGGYNASAELWGVNGYHYAQSLGVCSHDAWYVDVTTDNSKGDGAVKAYPSMRKIYHDWSTTDFSKDPLVSSFPRLNVSFGSKDPSSCSGCIYDTAFDIWLNGIGNGNANELMIWTHNVNQYPYGNKVASGVKIAGHTWDLYSGNSNHYLAYVPTDTSNISSATFDLKDFTSDLMSRGKISRSSRLGQISYGVETVSTGGVSKHWDFTKFTVVDR